MANPAFYITTPIYYCNDVPHIGHAYTTLACDVMARFKRLDGFDVKFLTGTDEHGLKVEQAARDRGISPQELVDTVSPRFLELANAIGATNDDFIRTTEERHKVAVQHLWQKLEAAGDIYLDTYEGWYSVRDEAFYQEGELQDGPDGKKVAPTGAPVEWVEEESYFFRLSAFEDRLLAFYDANPDFLAPKSRLNEVTSFVNGGLRDLSISRTTFEWGVPVPGNDKHIMYVWIDALTNYLTAVGYPDIDGESYKKNWPEVHHIIGKDILRFHAVYWPAFLMSAELPCPKRIFAHGWWTNEGEKISKSTGNVIDPFALMERYGRDQMRYFLMREVPFGNDGDFSHEAMVNRMNGELANDLGNLAQRSLSMVAKNCEGAIPKPGAFSASDQEILDELDNLLPKVRELIDAQSLNRALEAIWLVIGNANRYFAAEEPWALKKTDPERMGTVLYVAAEIIRQVAILVQPFIPDGAGKLLDVLGQGDRSFAALGAGGRLVPGTVIPKPEGVFPRFVDPDSDG